MLGEDDHNDLDNEPINAEDLFGDDLGLDGNENEPAADTGDPDGAPAAGSEDPSTGAAKPATKKRVINRLPNLNDQWLIDSKRENIRQVNGYFEKIKFKKGKGQERENLKMILQRYEYFGQNCYPKLCFKDFVEKVEFVSGKSRIKHVLQDIRLDRNMNPGGSDDDDDNGEEQAMNIEDPVPNTMPMNDDHQSTTSPARESSPPNSPPPPPPKPMTDEMREMIRKKREEALAKRKQKMDESMNKSITNENDEESTANEQLIEQSKTDENSKSENRKNEVDANSTLKENEENVNAENVNEEKNLESNGSSETKEQENKKNENENETDFEIDLEKASTQESVITKNNEQEEMNKITEESKMDID